MKYENLPNSLGELNRMKAALPEMQRAESQRIAQARADLEKEVEAFKADVPMIEDPEKEYKVKITFIKALIICGLLMVIAPIFFLEDEASAIAVIILGGILLIAGIIMGFIVSEINYPHEEEKAEYQLACTDFEAYKEKKAKEFADKRERELREREFKLKDEARLIDRKIREVKAKMPHLRLGESCANRRGRKVDGFHRSGYCGRRRTQQSVSRQVLPLLQLRLPLVTPVRI